MGKNNRERDKLEIEKKQEFMKDIEMVDSIPSHFVALKTLTREWHLSYKVRF